MQVNYLNLIKKLLNDVNEIDYHKSYIIHFKYKSTEEYINKLKRGYDWENKAFIDLRIKEYFEDNNVTLEKIEYMQKELKMNLSKYKKFIPLNRKEKKNFKFKRI